MVSTKLFLTYNELLQPLGKMLEFAKCILEGVVLVGFWSIMWLVLIELTTLNWRWWMIISFSTSVTGINTLLSKKFTWKINDLSTENLLDLVLNYTEKNTHTHTQKSKEMYLQIRWPSSTRSSKNLMGYQSSWSIHGPWSLPYCSSLYILQPVCNNYGFCRTHIHWQLGLFIGSWWAMNLVMHVAGRLWSEY